MLKDDRMMGMLTFAVILVAAGTLLQRVDFVKRLFDPGSAAVVLKADAAQIRASGPARIDVLANDTGSIDARALTIVRPPACGRASAREGVIEYLPSRTCIGEQTLRYGVGTEGQSAELRITVTPAAGSPGEPKTAVGPGVPTNESGTASSKGAGQWTDPWADQGSDQASDQAAGQAGASADVPAASEPAAEPATSAGTADAGPTDGEAVAGVAVSALEPDRGEAATGGASGTESTGHAPSGGAAPGASAASRSGACTTPPTITLDLGPGAVTEVEVDAPCQPISVAEVAYDGLRFGIRIDGRGRGSTTLPGLQRSTEATITFQDGEPLAFNLPFEGIERIDRVVIAWQGEAGLALNAFEFGARPGGSGHLSPAAPQSFEAVRREGGGWLSSFEPVAGKGQRIDVYSFWRRHSGPSGVVRLALDPGDGSGACRNGAADGADYVVLRSMGGRLERSRLGRIAPLDCTVLAGAQHRYIANAVDDLIVRHR